MIDIRHLIDFLPFYYKYNDTYKVNGKGILERFLEICGNYFTDNIKSVIDNSLDIMDLESTSQQYLAWIWELLGQIPFAQKPGVMPLRLTEEQQRDLIKYSNELLKIRGTKQFFEVMFEIYANSTNQLKLVSITSESFGWEEDQKTGSYTMFPYFDYDHFDDDTIRMDEYHRMKQCIDVTFTITGSFGAQEESARKAIKAFIRRFVPYNVNPIVKVNGVEVTDTYKLVLEVLKDGEWVNPESVEILSIGQLLKARVYLINTSSIGKEIVEGLEFKSKLNSGESITRTSIYEFIISSVFSAQDTYTFTFEGPTKDNADKTVSLSVKAAAVKSISYTMSIDKTVIDLTDTLREAKVKVTAYYNDGSGNVGAPVMCIETGEVKYPAEGSTVTDWTFEKPGTYTFIMIGHTASSVKLTVNGMVKYYTVELAKAKYNSTTKQYEADGAYSSSLNLSGPNVSNLMFMVKVTSSDSQETGNKLACYIKGNPSVIYLSGAAYKPAGFDVYEFIPVESSPNNKNAVLTVTSGIINFITSVINQSANPSVLDNSHAEVWADIQSRPMSLEASKMVDRGLDFVLELPDGKLVDLPYNSTKSFDGGTVTFTSKNTIRITTSKSGEYTVWNKAFQSSKAIWFVTDNRSTEKVPEGVMIVPEDAVGWIGGNTENAVFQLAEDRLEAHYKLSGYFNDGGQKMGIDISGAEITASDGKSYELGTVYTETEVKKIDFTVKYTDSSGTAHTWTCSVQVKDYASVINLSCTPSAALLNNGSATTKLSISSNKSSDVLKIKLKSTGDLYNDGDTFLANEPGDYEFIAMVNGTEATDDTGNVIKVIFKVTDPTAIAVTPETLEFEADGTPVAGNTFQITTGENTDWVLVLS